MKRLLLLMVFVLGAASSVSLAADVTEKAFVIEHSMDVPTINFVNVSHIEKFNECTYVSYEGKVAIELIYVDLATHIDPGLTYIINDKSMLNTEKVITYHNVTRGEPVSSGTSA